MEMDDRTGQSLQGFDQAGTALPGSLQCTSNKTHISLTDIDIRIQTSGPFSKPFFLANTTIHFLSAVDPSRIPLHLVAGRALEVYTSNEVTEKWMSINLVQGCFQTLEDYGEDRGITERLQSDIGVLMRVDGETMVNEVGPRITELLLYATLSLEDGQSREGILTPPRLSSPVPEHPQFQAGTTRIYALPLSSELSHNSAIRLPPSPPPEDLEDGQGRFFPPVDFASISQSRKRQRLDSLFDGVVQQNKRARRHGGETVSKAMASIECRPVSRGAKTPTEAPTQPEMLARKRSNPPNPSLSRAHSIGSLRDIQDARPLSRNGPLALTKRSSLHRVASTSILSSSPLLPEPISGLEQQNKATLSRIIMAGMRMYGLQQRKKVERSRMGSENAPTGPEDPIQLEEDEYKLVYHQTYKAAAFVFRKHMSSILLAQDLISDTVDHFLAMFCSDPLASEPESGNLQLSKGTEGNYVFDSPSNNAEPVTISPVRTNKVVVNG